MPNSLMRSLRTLFKIKRTEREMDRELRFHLEMETEENIRRGMAPEEARLVALRSFGGVERFKEECRDVKRNRPLETLWQDTRFGARVLGRNPGFMLVAVLTLSLGIGANTAIFSVVYGVLLRPLPYQQGGQLVVLKQQAPLARNNNLNFSVKEIDDYRAQNRTLADLAEYGLNTSTPVWGEDNLLFVSSAYGGGSRVIKLTRDGDKTTVEEVWAHNMMRVHFSNCIRVGDLVFGSSGDFGPAPFMAINVKTGKIAWRDRSLARANFLYVDGRFIILDEDGRLALATPSPEGLNVHCKTELLPGLTWTAPTLTGTKLYVRNRKTILALELG